MNKQSKKNFSLSCSWKNCSSVFSDEHTFYDHVSAHLPDLEVKEYDGESVYVCGWKTCFFSTKDSEQVTRHVKFHGYHTILKAKGSAFMNEKQLPVCTFSEEETFSLFPQQLESIICFWSSCNEQFLGIKELTDHIAYIHVGSLNEKPGSKYLCQWKDCKVSAGKKCKLLEHVKTHVGDKKIACPQCGSCFATTTKFSDHCHRQLQVDEQSFQCSYCFSCLPNERLLREHMRQHVHHYKCEYCGMTCHTPAILKRHIKYRHNPERNFSCQLCSYRCKTYSDLRQHIVGHTESKFTELSCNEPDCTFKCKLQSVLTRHFYQTHSELKKVGRYCCHLCDKSYTRGNSLTQHLCSEHNVRKPSEYSRFIYKTGSDGCNRLQTIRLESLEASENDKKIIIDDSSDEDDVKELEDESVKEEPEIITIDLVDESGQIILSNNIDTVIAEDTLPPDAKIVAIGQ